MILTDGTGRVAHRTTRAEGTVIALVSRLHPGDTEGPWAQVAFDDGLTCWVPEHRLDVLR